MKKVNARHNDNTESRKNALKALMGGIQMGNKVFILVPLEDLYSQMMKFAKTYAAIIVLLVFFLRGFVVTNVLGQICSKPSKS